LPVLDRGRVSRLAHEMRAEPRVDWRLYEFTVDVAMLVRHGEHPTSTGYPGHAVRQVWRDPAVRRRGGRR